MPDAQTKLAEGERLHGLMLANAGGDFEVDCDEDFRIWCKQNIPALLAGMRALVEIASNEPLDIDPRIRYLEVQVQRETWKAAKDAVDAFTKEGA